MRCLRTRFRLFPTAVLCVGLLPAQIWTELRSPGGTSTVCADTTRGKLLFVGAYYGGGIGQIQERASWWFDGQHWSLAAAAGAPAPLGQGVLQHDPVRGRTVFFAIAGPPTAWEHDGTSWSQVSTGSHPPALRSSMVFADHLAVLVLHSDDGSTWHFDGQDWTQAVTANAPPPRSWFGLGYDPGRQVVVLHGGTGAQTSLDDTWEYDGSDWTQRSPMHQPPAGKMTMTFDPTRSAMLARVDYGTLSGTDWSYDGVDWSPLPMAYGRYPWATHTLTVSPMSGRPVWISEGVAANETFLVDEHLGTTWAPLLASATPQTRFGSAVAVDPRTDTMMLFGGCSSDPDYPVDDQWLRVGDTWFPSGAAPRPAARLFHGLVHDTARDQFVLVGGYGGNNAFLGDVWYYRQGQWQVELGPTPPNRERHAIAYDPIRRRVVVFGGRYASSSTALRADLWFFDGTAWTSIPAPNGPSARAGAVMTYDAANDRLVLFGGETANGFSDETWALVDTTWTLLQTNGSPAPRSAAAMAYDPFVGDVLLLGGRDLTTTFGDSWQLRGSNWSAATSTPPLRPRWAGNLVSVPARRRLELMRGAIVSSFFGQPYGASMRDLLTREAGPQPNVARHGVGCVGASGVPDLSPAAGSSPALGTSFVVELSGVPQASFALIALGTRIDRWAGEPLPVALDVAGLAGCHLWIEPTAFTIPTVQAGVGAASVTIPSIPGLSGSILAAQGLLLDPASGNGVGALSNALVATIR